MSRVMIFKKDKVNLANRPGDILYYNYESRTKDQR